MHLPQSDVTLAQDVAEVGDAHKLCIIHTQVTLSGQGHLRLLKQQTCEHII